MMEGTPTCATQQATNTLATVSAVIFAIGSASGWRVKWSTQVSKYVKVLEGGMVQLYQDGYNQTECQV